MSFIAGVILSIFTMYIVINLKFLSYKFKGIFLVTWTLLYFKSLLILLTVLVWVLKINLGFDRDIEGRKNNKYTFKTKRKFRK